MIRNKKIVNGLGVLSGYAKYLSILALAAVLTALAVSSFCTHTPENCADGQELKPGMFCFDNKAWNKCGGSEYNPYTQFCSAAETLYDKCGGKDDYDPLREFCSGNKVVSKCGNATFDPVTQGCVSGIVKEQCGNNHFDPNNEFCFQNRIYDKCNGKQFDPTKDVCVQGEVVKPKCGAGNYDIGTQFCYSNMVYTKCNGNEYNPTESFCVGGVKYALCGGQKYDPAKQSCNGTSIVDILRCGGVEYDSAASFCNNNIVYAKCGVKVYDPSRQSCDGTNIVDILKCGGVEYDGAAKFCYNNTIYAKCGGSVYDPSTKTCNGTSIVDIVKFTVYFNANGGMDGADPPTTVKADSGKTIRIPGQQTISRNGYSFGGWNTSPSGAGTYYSVNDQYTVTGNVTLYVRWIPIRTITFDGNGSTSGDPPEPVSADSGTAVKLPNNRTLVRTGYSFGGWNTNNTGTGIGYRADSAYTVTINVILFVRWIPIYTVTFNGNNQTSGTPPEQMKADSGTTIPLPNQGNLVRTNYSFGWWSTSNTGIGISYHSGDSYIVTGNVNLYVKWIPIYTVTFDGNGVTSGVPIAVKADSGKSVILPYAMTRSGYNFSGWGTTSGNNYLANSSYTVTSNTTLYARWMSATVISGTFTDTRNSQTYRTVKIGNQTWMAENLNYSTSNSWCYSGSADNCSKYGRLYDWATAKTACPLGWHLPTREEWGELVISAGGIFNTYDTHSMAGKVLKSMSGWSNNNNGTDDFGFSALPGGYYESINGYFQDAGCYGYWWTAKETGTNSAADKRMSCFSDNVYEGSFYKSDRFSVRCVQDVR